MICDRYAPYLSGFAGGELRADTARLVGAHARACASCLAEVALQRRVIGALAQSDPGTVYVPAGLAEDILERVSEHERLGPVGAVLPMPVVETARRVVGDPRVRRAATVTVDAARTVTDTRAGKAAVAATGAAVAGGIFALVRRRRSRGVQPA